MILKLGKDIRISKPNKEVIDYVTKNLTITNPDYDKKRRMGFWLGGTPKTIRLYAVDGDELIVPYGTLNELRNMEEVGDHEELLFLPRNRVDFKCKIPLYDYQEDAVNAMLFYPCGILQAPAGSGKTQMGLALASQLQGKTLWLTHTQDLLNQSMSRAEQYMDKSLLGTITAGKVKIGKAITFATVQTLSKMDVSMFRETWDTVIVDECHRICVSANGVSMFQRCLSHLSARHKYGLSATVHRADGLIKATYAIIGSVRYTVPDTEVADKIMPVSILPQFLNTPRSIEYLDTDGTIIYTKLLDYLTGCDERNQSIIADLVYNADHYNLILSDRLEHLDTIMRNLPPPLREQAVMISGRMTSKWQKAEREQAIEDMRTGKKRYLFATYSLAKEGLDIPRLDRLYLTTPQKDYAVVVQSIGRVARTFTDKDEPIVYDYVDRQLSSMCKKYRARLGIYRKQKCKILGGDD